MLPDAEGHLPKGYANAIAGCATIFLILVEEVAIALTRGTYAASDMEICSSCGGAPGNCYFMSDDAYHLLDTETPPAPAKMSSSVLRKPSFSRALGVFRSGRYAYGIRKAVSLIGVAPKQSRGPTNASPAVVGGLPVYLPQGSPHGAAAYPGVVLPEDCHTQMMTQGAESAGSVTKAVCLFVALSFHSVLEGIGLGTASRYSELGAIAAAILAHKGLAAFALGNALRQSNGMSHRGIMLLAVAFASATPAGIGIGIIVMNFAEGPVVGVFTACAAGTFLQVALMEIIPSALQATLGESRIGRMFRVLAIAVGFALMSALVFAVG